MSLLQVSLNNLKELDMGKVSLALDEHIKRAARDCYDRPNDKKARKVVLQINIIPVCHDDGTCDEVSAQILAKSSVPEHKTKAYSFGLRANGTLVFNPDSPGNVNQSTLLPDDEE